MHITLQKISPTHHRFTYTREDGTGESLELETKSFLMHDLLHFAVETEAGLTHSFYGLLNQMEAYATLSGENTQLPLGSQILHTERIVGILTGFTKGSITPQEALDAIANLYTALNEDTPEWVSLEMLTRIETRLKALMGEWRGTPFGEEMKLLFDL